MINQFLKLVLTYVNNSQYTIFYMHILCVVNYGDKTIKEKKKQHGKGFACVHCTYGQGSLFVSQACG